MCNYRENEKNLRTDFLKGKKERRERKKKEKERRKNDISLLK